MKLQIKHFFKTPMLLVFVAMIVIFAFGALGTPAEINRYAIVTAVGIDLLGDDEEVSGNKYEISLLTFVPVAQQNFAERYKMISSKGRSVSEAMDFAGLHIGREVGLSHVKMVVLNEELLKDDVSNFLDYLIRSIQLSSSTKLIATDSSAKDFLSVAQQLDSESSIKVSELISYNKNYVYGTDSSLETFFKGTYGPTKVGLMSFVSVESGEGEGISASVIDSQNGGSGASGGNSQSKESSSSQTKEIINDGETLVFKDGKEVLKLTGADVEKINLIKGNYRTGAIEIKHFTDVVFNDANLTFEIFDQTNNFKVKFENGIPVIYIDTSLTVRLSEVENSGESPKENIELLAMTDEAIDAIIKEVKLSMSEGIELMRENQVDIADFYTSLYNSNRKAFLKFLEELEDPESYLTHAVFKASVRVYSK